MEVAARIVVDLLVRKDYEAVARLDAQGFVRLEPEELEPEFLEEAVAEYGRTLTTPPADWWTMARITPITVDDVRRFHVDVPMWTKEEGRSDLSLELQLSEIHQDVYETSVLGLRVL